ncbi:Putative phage integrase [Pseudomonas pohangensis]|uniref:Putative phage integrase n=1 Tax=Pseudomonas pohangensis TaxID=364197 RepID=A0A1H2GZ29_9PSED|nr:integrase family protein [Pseudomonas pohangensis]SDU24862.1 Putative phage integrase [Pseudomonas pohangensis]
MPAKGIKNNGRASDLTLGWLTKDHGEKWEDWRTLMAGWMKDQHQGVTQKLSGLALFAMHYLPKVPIGHQPAGLFQAARQGAIPCLAGILGEIQSERMVVKIQNYIVNFIDWVIEHHFSEPNDQGRMIPMVDNPFKRASHKGISLTETVRNPLPYAYIKELREILCPQPFGDFNDWAWAHQAFPQAMINGKGSGKGGDWFKIDPARIDTADPDCVWRTRTVTRDWRGPVKIHQIWSPVRSVALLIKLHLPLRTYQVRFLDSGEADTWRYEKGQWVLNQQHSFKSGSEKNPWNRGVFCRIRSPDIGEIMTGLYVNTNKTADQKKEERERGYTIPWQHAEVLYWLEKLRNWQEKYNPIDSPTPCTNLEAKHFGNTKSEQQKCEMGDICFLFRFAGANVQERGKPIGAHALEKLWFRLLSTLEDRVAARGQTLSDGSRLRFVMLNPDGHISNQTATEFPLHSLRVSLLTCYAMEGQVPIPVLSKLIAGHSRLLMTLYYIKPTPAMMTQALDAATEKVDAAQSESLRTFLRDADMRQITCKVAYREESSLQAALANRNPVGWEHRHIGLCLVGGNSAKSDETGNVGGCWNGGEYIRPLGNDLQQYGPVPNGPENCVRCRWFVTDASYLDALRAHFNTISYKASLAVNLAIEHEQARDDLLDARYLATEQGLPFLQQHELQEAERRYEKQIVLADQYAKDLVACFQLIGRLIAIEEGRTESDNATKLVAVGSMQDIHQPISFIETRSELLQLVQICEDAEIYPDLADDLRKTPAIEKRSRALNNLLMRNGYSPVFMQMDECMQLIAGNAMLRAMARQASPNDQLEGFSYVAGALEAGQHLKLLPDGIKALEEVYQGPVIKLSDLIATSAKAILKFSHD